MSSHCSDQYLTKIAYFSYIENLKKLVFFLNYRTYVFKQLILDHKFKLLIGENDPEDYIEVLWWQGENTYGRYDPGKWNDLFESRPLAFACSHQLDYSLPEAQFLLSLIFIIILIDLKLGI